MEKPKKDEELERAATVAERELARQLTEGDMDNRDAEEEAVTKLSPRWEVRIQSERDPVAEETTLYRKMAKEVDDRYGEDSESSERAGDISKSV